MIKSPYLHLSISIEFFFKYKILLTNSVKNLLTDFEPSAIYSSHSSQSSNFTECHRAFFIYNSYLNCSRGFWYHTSLGFFHYSCSRSSYFIGKSCSQYGVLFSGYVSSYVGTVGTYFIFGSFYHFLTTSLASTFVLLSLFPFFLQFDRLDPH